MDADSTQPNSVKKTEEKEEHARKLGILLGDVKATRKNLAMYALAGGILMLATFGVIGINAWIALVTVIMAAFFIFKLMKEFGDLQSLGREITQLRAR